MSCANLFFFAVAFFHEVRVLVLGVDPLAPHYVSEREVHETPFAAVIQRGIAVHQLLLRERYQLARHNLVDPFNCCH